MISWLIPGGVKFTPLLFLIIFLSYPPPFCSAGENAARVTRVQGVVYCTRPGTSGVRKLRAGELVQVADALETGKQSRLQLLLSDDSVITLSPETLLRISQYSFDRKKNRRTAVVSLKKGGGRFILQQELKDGSGFLIETGQAQVRASIADLVVEAGGQQTGVYSLSGAVGLRNSSNLVIGNIRVGENSCSMVREKNPPSDPILISPHQRRRYTRDAYQF